MRAAGRRPAAPASVSAEALSLGRPAGRTTSGRINKGARVRPAVGLRKRRRRFVATTGRRRLGQAAPNLFGTGVPANWHRQPDGRQLAGPTHWPQPYDLLRPIRRLLTFLISLAALDRRRAHTLTSLFAPPPPPTLRAYTPRLLHAQGRGWSRPARRLYRRRHRLPRHHQHQRDGHRAQGLGRW